MHLPLPPSCSDTTNVDQMHVCLCENTDFTAISYGFYGFYDVRVDKNLLKLILAPHIVKLLKDSEAKQTAFLKLMSPRKFRVKDICILFINQNV